MARRVCLIKIVLSTLPLYHMSVFLMPKRVARVITLVKRRFLWCGDSKDQKIYKVAWQMLVRGNNRGGLDIHWKARTRRCYLNGYGGYEIII